MTKTGINLLCVDNASAKVIGAVAIRKSLNASIQIFSADTITTFQSIHTKDDKPDKTRHTNDPPQAI